MAEFFRFRSIDALLGKFQELEKQTIYFASPEELDDPMEGLRDIVWNGDQIVWTHFLKHYIFCLNRCYLPLNITPKPRKSDVADIPILERWDQITTPIEKTLFDDIWDRFCNLPYIQEIIEALSNSSHKIGYREIVCYLRSIQTLVLLDEIRKTYIDHGIISELLIPQPGEESDVAVQMEQLLILITNTEAITDERARDAILQTMEGHLDDIWLTVEFNTRTHPPEILGGMNRILMLDFPRVYVEQLDRLLWPKWYTACFTESYHNSSMWAKYADGHKGACLIFGTEEKDSMNHLVLHHKTSKGSSTMPFRKIKYADKPGKTDFFRTIGRVTVYTLRKLWYTDQNGNISECAARLESKQNQAAWRENYWNNFFRNTTTKITDWAYEKEYRLVLDDGLSEFNKKNDRILTYDFNSLKGIIFGMRTSTEDKKKIIDIIEKKKKCNGNNQADFTYFQTNYSPEDGNIHKRRMQLPDLHP